jgi:activator of HSP90 ATPase
MNEHTKPPAPPSTKTRRQAIASIAVGLVAGVRALAEAQQPSMKQATASAEKHAPAAAENRKRTSLHQEIDFKAPPQRIYEILLSSKDFTAFSGAPAEIDPKAGGTFSMFGGMVVGRNVELVPNQRIVQAWRVIGDWPEGVYTLVKFELKPRAPGTTLLLDHTGFGEGDFDHLNAGWYSHYWEPLKKFLA